MANEFLDATEYSKVMLLLLKNQLVAGRLVDGQFKNQVTDENGLTINVKRPPQFVAQDGEALALQDIVVGQAQTKVDQYKNVHIDVGDLESIQSYNQLMEDSTMEAAASELAHQIDSSIHAVFPQFSSSVGTPGVAISTPQQFNKVHTRLMDQSVPNVNLKSVVNFEDGELIRGNILTTDLTGRNTNLDAMQKIKIPILSEIDLFATQQTRTITPGTRTNGAIDGANQNVDYRTVKDALTQTLTIDGLGANATIEAGAVFEVADVLAVNNRSRQALSYPKQFTVITAVTASAGGAATVTISPPMIVPNTDVSGSIPKNLIVNTAFQTVDSAPADSAVVTWSVAAGASPTAVRVAFHKRAISLVSAKLRTPFSDTSSFISDPETGIGIRYWRGSDIVSGRHIHRWDTVYGVQMMQSELGARVNGT